MSRFVAGCLGLVLILGGYAGTANAQAEAGAQSLLIAPGARSDGMGRAYVAVAKCERRLVEPGRPRIHDRS